MRRCFIMYARYEHCLTGASLEQALIGDFSFTYFHLTFIFTVFSILSSAVAFTI